MIKTKFKKIAEEEGATIKISDEDILIGGGVRSPNLEFFLTLPYKDKKITLYNASGTSYEGRVTTKFSEPKEALVFEMTTRNHFIQLFYWNKNRFKVRAENPGIESFLRNSVALENLKNIAKDTAFEPRIVGENTKDGFRLIITYHLQFSDWTQVVSPLLQFHKEFIDKFG